MWAFSLNELRRDRGAIPLENVQLFMEQTVSVAEYPAWFLRLTPHLRALREYPDVLVPLPLAQGVASFNAPPERTSALWLDIHVPVGTSAGVYESKIRLMPRAGAAHEMNLVLEVWPFALPQTRHVMVVAGLSSQELMRHHLTSGGQPYAPQRLSFADSAFGRAAAILDGAVRLLHEHRLSPVLTDVYPLANLSPEGRPILDWTDYDRLVAGILDGSLFDDRTTAAAWPVPVDHRNPPPDTHGRWGSAGHNRAVAEYLRQSIAHFREKGWLDRHYIWMSLPVGARPAQYDEFDRLARLLLSVEPRLNVVCPLTPQPMAPYGMQQDGFRDLSALVRTWCPPACLLDPAEMGRQRAQGKAAWFTPDRPPFSASTSLIAPALHARALPWQAFRFNCTGVLMPLVNQWPESGLPSASGSEASLIWPGKPFGLEHAVPSVRLKRLRRGLQDYEYLWLLGQNRRPGIAQLIAADLCAYGGTLAYGEHYLDGRPGGWVTDPAAWSLARRLMARELIAAMSQLPSAATRPAEDEDLSMFERQLEWARLTEATRGLRADVEGVRVEYDPRNTQAPLTVEATVSLFNAAREPFSGTLGFDRVPGTWSVESARLPVEKLESRRAARRVLSARVPDFTANPDGILTFDMVSESSGGYRKTSPARLAAITSQTLTRSITVDGKLDDWPLGTTNVAGDFLLVGAQDVPKPGRPDPLRASQQTIVFVCNDRTHLYIAFNCADNRLGERAVSRGNAVRYDELWPAGEDLVEVVLDPTHRAMDGGDLLHFVVKANGAVISERGVPCLAGATRYSDWPADVEAAVDDTVHPDRWTVEIRLPIRALAARPGIWGVNFGRLQARLGEYSSWSGARRYLYSPASLGNLRVDY